MLAGAGTPHDLMVRRLGAPVSDRHAARRAATTYRPRARWRGRWLRATLCVSEFVFARRRRAVPVRDRRSKPSPSSGRGCNYTATGWRSKPADHQVAWDSASVEHFHAWRGARQGARMEVSPGAGLGAHAAFTTGCWRPGCGSMVSEETPCGVSPDGQWNTDESYASDRDGDRCGSWLPPPPETGDQRPAPGYGRTPGEDGPPGRDDGRSLQSARQSGRWLRNRYPGSRGLWTGAGSSGFVGKRRSSSPGSSRSCGPGRNAVPRWGFRAGAPSRGQRSSFLAAVVSTTWPSISA